MTTRSRLRSYQAKRDFSQTSEPAEGGKSNSSAPVFVVQKHWASHLHYDFRLEWEGTLKSWAVPKGPSNDPHDKRMAIAVEDHPLAYAGFEGDIPAGQYGAGKVVIWDSGTWKPLSDPGTGLREGRLSFELHGNRLRGKWALIRIKAKDEKKQPWLLIKEKDEWAEPPAGPSTERAVSTLPPRLLPQLATLADAPPSDTDEWLYEIKFDGYRLLARVEDSGVQLFTRNGNDWSGKLGSLHSALVRCKLPDGWYDGEIVVLNDQGVPDFGALQNAFDVNATRDILYFLFDLPYCQGQDLRDLPLWQRRAQLKALLEKVPTNGPVRFSEIFEGAQDSVLASACRLGLEGVIAKRRESVYHDGSRTPDWLKLKCGQRQEFVIGGWTDPKGSRQGLGSLVLGVHDAKGELVHAGNVGTGFSENVLQDLKARFKPLATGKCPFGEVPQLQNVHWVLPKLVAEVSFSEWTHAHHIRHAVFQGLRSDKPAAAITRETPTSAAHVVHSESATALPDTLRITHPQRLVDPDSATTKIEVVRYYAQVGRLMMAHLKGRPLALVRAPAGVDGTKFFQKHAEVEKLPGVRQLPKTADEDQQAMLTITSRQGLLSAAQWNTLEFHTVNARAGMLGRPDRMVFDLDPGEGMDWPTLRQATQALHTLLQQLGLAAFLKTSGGKGLHIVVPLKPRYDWDQTRDFSRAVVEHIAHAQPQLFVTKSGARNRVGRIFIDYLRNGEAATTVSAWSLRARKGLGVSVPVNWDELPTMSGPSPWQLGNIQERLGIGNQPWRNYFRSAKTLTRAMRKLQYTP